ncbi:hypothetical protein VTK26DRAFT_8861 [Humicola hyalothermophila]
MIDEQSRFKVWCGNFAAHRTGSSSLDYRLRDASHIKSQVINFLRDLIQLIEDALAIGKGEQTPWDQDCPEEEDFEASDSDDDFPDTEMGQIAANMSSVEKTCLRRPPAICLVLNATALREFLRRHEWMEHVRQNHWATYKCANCDTAFSSSADCKAHFEAHHPASRSAAELEALVKLSRQPLGIRFGIPCPLCHDVMLHSAVQYQRHVGRHQEQLSLFALPSVDIEEEDEEDELASDESDIGEALAGRQGKYTRNSR